MGTIMDFGALMQSAVEQGASDLHIQAGELPMIRVGGEIRDIPGNVVVSQEQLVQLLEELTGTKDEPVSDAAVQGWDFSFSLSQTTRFRCSAYATMGRLGLVMRVIKTRIPSLTELNLPTVLMDIALSQRGLTLVTGTTGSGKSTTLAAMIDLINSNLATKIISIEDPIEYVHIRKKSLITQM